MWRKTLKRMDLRWLLAGCALLPEAGTWTLTLAQVAVSRRLQVADASGDARALVRLLGEHANRSIEAAGQAVMFLRHRYNRQGMAPAIQRALRDGLGPGDICNLFAIINERADVLLASKPFTPTNLGHREPIQLHMSGNSDALYISKPVQQRLAEQAA